VERSNVQQPSLRRSTTLENPKPATRLRLEIHLADFGDKSYKLLMRDLLNSSQRMITGIEFRENHPAFFDVYE
jgi:hypothetical protein